MEQFQTEKEKLQSILFNMNSDRNYWFIRTMSGRLYDEFYQENYVAIGHDGILMKDLQDLSDKEGAAREQLKLKLTDKEPDLTPAKSAKAAGRYSNSTERLRRVMLWSFQAPNRTNSQSANLLVKCMKTAVST